MVAKGGAKLIDDKAINLLKKKLLKKASLITPNIPEAEILTNTSIRCKEDMIFAAQKLIEIGVNNVLIKGGHLASNTVQDIFVSKSDIKIFNSKRYDTKNTHGTARGTPGFSGADLANLVNESALLAARKNKRIVTLIEFEEAKDKVMMGSERRSMVMTEDEKKLTAYHEGGEQFNDIK